MASGFTGNKATLNRYLTHNKLAAKKSGVAELEYDVKSARSNLQHHTLIQQRLELYQ